MSQNIILPSIVERPTLTFKEVEEAEALRTRGDLKSALSIVRSVKTIPEGRLTELDNAGLATLMAAARIDVVCETSLANQSWRAVSVLNHLTKACQSVDTIYNNPAVSDASQRLDKDPKAREYDFDLEMARDKARLLIVVSGLTGDVKFLTQAMDVLALAAGQVKTPGSSAKTLADFELARVAHKYYGFDLDTGYREKFRAAVDDAREHGNWERTATVSALFAIDSARGRNFKHVKEGLRLSKEARQQDPNTTGILKRQVLKELSWPIRTKHWRLTSLGVPGLKSKIWDLAQALK